MLFAAIMQRIVVIPYLRFETDNLARNVGKELLHLATWWLRRAQFSSSSRRKPGVTLIQYFRLPLPLKAEAGYSFLEFVFQLDYKITTSFRRFCFILQTKHQRPVNLTYRSDSGVCCLQSLHFV